MTTLSVEDVTGLEEVEDDQEDEKEELEEGLKRFCLCFNVRMRTCHETQFSVLVYRL